MFCHDSRFTSQAPSGVPSPRRDLRPTSPWAVSPACCPPDSPGPWVSMGNMGKHGETLGNWILESWKCRRYPKMLENCVHGSHLPWATEGDHLLAIVKWYCGKIKFGPALPARIGLIAEAGISSVEGNINFILGFEVDTFPAQIATVLIANCQVLCSTFPSTKWWLGWL